MTNSSFVFNSAAKYAFAPRTPLLLTTSTIRYASGSSAFLRLHASSRFSEYTMRSPLDNAGWISSMVHGTCTLTMSPWGYRDADSSVHARPGCRVQS
ncbi:hypothetical protein A0H81_08852 [Grifola frondosa]|uniref:Uncharacterized protein n=1 Tax=Grifola frondosa TaxID=5627 RepID=A0A1C7M4U2_GRIFR|nr:hypothetical protein A0H81_08852 [Grifola frondosa]